MLYSTSLLDGFVWIEQRVVASGVLVMVSPNHTLDIICFAEVVHLSAGSRGSLAA
jgi:hypothetical protein